MIYRLIGFLKSDRDSLNLFHSGFRVFFKKWQAWETENWDSSLKKKINWCCLQLISRNVDAYILLPWQPWIFLYFLCNYLHFHVIVMTFLDDFFLKTHLSFFFFYRTVIKDIQSNSEFSAFFSEASEILLM